MLTATKGTAVLNTNFSHYGPWCGDVNVRENGSLVAHETGQVTAYALKSVQERGVLFVRPGDKIYEGQVRDYGGVDGGWGVVGAVSSGELSVRGEGL